MWLTTLKERMVHAILRDCPETWQTGLSMNGIMLRIPKDLKPPVLSFAEAKSIIKDCIDKNCGMRNEEVRFYIRKGMEGSSFLIRKSEEFE